MGKADTRSVSESAARAYRIAVRHEIQKLERELDLAAANGGGDALQGEEFRLLGKLPLMFWELWSSREALRQESEAHRAEHAELETLRSELEILRRSEPLLRESLKEYRSLSQLSRQINATLKLDQILWLLASLSAQIVEIEGSIVYLYDEASGQHRRAAIDRLGDDTCKAIQFMLDAGVMKAVTSEARPTIVPEILTAARSGGAERSLILVPLSLHERPIGLLVMLSNQPQASFFQHDLELLGLLANTVAVAIGNALLFEKTQRLSVTDDLTQLANSRFLAEFLDRAIGEAAKESGKLALLFSDLDGFKEINDRYGHRMGSAALVEVSQILRANVRERDVTARFGGDEFVMVLAGADAATARQVAEKIRRAIAERVFLGAHGIEAHLTVSIGIATYPDHASTATELISHADSAMYSVKYRGKNGHALWEPPREKPAPMR
ncbi:MAG: sensor domain-containing diguanylate cyclase [Acidobacteriota bacterium]